jgi:hypothetical protein
MRTYLGIVAALLLFLTAAAPAKAAGALTDDSLKTMLDNLGYTVEVSGDKAPHRYKFKESLNDGSLSFTITVLLSSDSTILWIYTALYELPTGKPASGPLLALLAKNDDIGPQFFSYSTDTKFFYLNAPGANVDMTPKVLHQRLANLISTLSKTRDLWDTDKWK